MNIKKLLAVILAVVMLLCVLPVAYAASGDEAIPEDGDISVDVGDVEDVPEETEPEVVLGDISGDGIVDTLDLTALQAYVSGKASSVNSAAADIDSDGVVDTIDLTALQAYVAGKTTTLG